MRFVLFCVNVALLVLLGTYLLDIFSIRSYGAEAIVFLFVAAVAIAVLTNEMIETHKLSRPELLLVPAFVALALPFLLGKPFGVAIMLGWMAVIPGLVVIIRASIKPPEKAAAPQQQ